MSNENQEQNLDEQPKFDWKQISVLAFDVRLAGSGPSARIIEVALLQQQILCPVNFTQNWLINPGEISWDDPEVVRALQENATDREKLTSSMPIKSLYATIHRVQYLSAIWCAYDLERKLGWLGREFEGEGLPVASAEGKLLLDIAVIDQGLNPGCTDYDLESISARWGIEFGTDRCARHEAVVCKQILKAMMPRLPEDPAEMFKLIDDWQRRFSTTGSEGLPEKNAPRKEGK